MAKIKQTLPDTTDTDDPFDAATLAWERGELVWEPVKTQTEGAPAASGVAAARARVPGGVLLLVRIREQAHVTFLPEASSR
jgi:hypothetical protein